MKSKRIGSTMLCIAVLCGSGVGYAESQHEFQWPENWPGFGSSPVPLNLTGKNRALVARGSYIVNALGGCNDCHTYPSYAEGGDPFKGEREQINTSQYLAGGRIFGPFVSRNITPDISGKPAGLTFREFETVIRTGKEPENPGELLQVMPWPVYGKMSQLDLRAVYEYLSAIPSLEDNPSPGE